MQLDRVTVSMARAPFLMILGSCLLLYSFKLEKSRPFANFFSRPLAPLKHSPMEDRPLSGHTVTKSLRKSPVSSILKSITGINVILIG